MAVFDLAIEVIKTGVKTATAIYNKVAEQLPVPLPKLGDEPQARWEPPPPPPRPAAKPAPAPKPAAPKPAAPKPAAPKPAGIQVDKGGPSVAEYRAEKAKAPAKKKAAPAKKKAAPAKKKAAPAKKKAAPAKKKAAPAKKKAAPAKKKAAPALDSLKKAELQAMCDKAGKKYTQRMTKAQLIELLK